MLDQIKAKQAEAATLVRELEGSLEIKKLWSEAFDHGRVSTRLVDRGVGLGGFKREVYKIIITNGLGESRSFPTTDLNQDIFGFAK